MLATEEILRYINSLNASDFEESNAAYVSKKNNIRVFIPTHNNNPLSNYRTIYIDGYNYDIPRLHIYPLINAIDIMIFDKKNKDADKSHKKLLQKIKRVLG